MRNYSVRCRYCGLSFTNEGITAHEIICPEAGAGRNIESFQFDRIAALQDGLVTLRQEMMRQREGNGGDIRTLIGMVNDLIPKELL